MKISIIIPTYNEEACIGRLVQFLQKHRNNELEDIIVVDGASTDQTVKLAEQEGAVVFVSPKKGRAQQMNYGARKAKGDILYFVHADSLPPASFTSDILSAVEAGYPIGSYRTRFNSNRFMLKVNAYFSRFDRIMCRGGDQTIYVTKDLFNRLNGYCERHKIMEDYNFIIRAKKIARFKIFPKCTLISIRKYEDNSYWRVNLANLTVFTMFFLDFPQDTMIKTYKRMMNQDKL